MTWHCPRWTENLLGNYPDHTFADGDDCDEIYSDARCTSFSRVGWFTVDEDDSQYDSGIDDGSDAVCNEHDRSADWDYYSATSDLRNAGFYVCGDCDATFHDDEAGNEHYRHEHDEAFDPEAEPTPYWHHNRPTPGIRTSHSGWVS